MTKGQGIVLLLLLFAILIILCVNFFLGERSRAVKWEYRIESIEDLSFSKDMQKLGDDGWELIFARRAVTGEGLLSRGIYECIFRKPKL